MKLKEIISLFIIIASIVILLVMGIKIGTYASDWDTILTAITNYDSSSNEHFAIIELRMPRLLTALLIGGLLALSGYLMQAMVNNPLADPYLLGTSSGAGLGASIVYAGLIPANIYTISLLSFSGAVLVTFICIAIAFRNGQIEPSKLLLSGVALSSLMVSITGLIMYVSGDENQLRNIIYWTMGGFYLSNWSQIPLLFTILITLLVLFIFYQNSLSILLLGENQAMNLGVNIKKLRIIVLLSCSLATGIAVSVAGPIGFAGLIIPHFIRSTYGVTGKFNIHFTVLWGSVFLLACDVLSRYIFSQNNIPIGIITSFIGIPFFIILLSKNKLKF